VLKRHGSCSRRQISVPPRSPSRPVFRVCANSTRRSRRSSPSRRWR
jgi:hypothetical protein